jgi:hypothetical protein
VGTGAKLLTESWDRPKQRVESGTPDADFSSSTAGNLPSGGLKRDSAEAPPREAGFKTMAGNSGEPQFRTARTDGASCGMALAPWQFLTAAACVYDGWQF